MRPWLTRLLLLSWLSLGLLVLGFLPADELPGPVAAEEMYGNTRSIQSSAPDGVLAFARVLAKLGYDVGDNRRLGVPEGEVLFLLAPEIPPSPAEIDVLIHWVRGGGRLVYASPEISFSVDGEEKSHALPDPLLKALAEVGQDDPALGAIEGVTDARAIGLGLAVILNQRGSALTNASLRKVGLAPEWPWLTHVLAGKRQVRFDEARLGTVAQETLIELLRRSRFGPAVLLAAVAFVLWFLGRVVRRQPAHEEPRPFGRAYAEHLNAVGELFRRTKRLLLASHTLRAGTLRRLGFLAHTPRARALLDELSLPDKTGAELVRRAEALRRLEHELGLAGTDATIIPGSARQ